MRHFKFLLSFILIYSLNLLNASAQNVSDQVHIVIDPGHGFTSSIPEGVNWSSQIYNNETVYQDDGRCYLEIENTLAVSLKLKDLLESNCENVVVHMTRTENVYAYSEWMSTTQRAEFANTVNNGGSADVFISVHSNAFGCECGVNCEYGGRGTETFYSSVISSGVNQNSDSSYSLAKNISKNLVNYLGLFPRNTGNPIDYPWDVLYYTDCEYSVLSEMAFHTNSRELSMMQMECSRQAFADGYFHAILETLGDDIVSHEVPIYSPEPNNLLFPNENSLVSGLAPLINNERVSDTLYGTLSTSQEDFQDVYYFPIHSDYSGELILEIDVCDEVDYSVGFMSLEGLFLNNGNVNNTTLIEHCVPTGSCNTNYVLVISPAAESFGTPAPYTISYSWMPGEEGFFCGNFDLAPSLERLSELLEVSASESEVCSGNPVTLSASGGSGQYLWNGPDVSDEPGSTIIVCPEISGTYTVTDGFGCSSNQTSVDITVLDSPTVSIDSDPEDPISNGESVALLAVANGSGSFDFEWTGPDVPASTSHIISVSPEESSSYGVTAIDEDGCQASAETLVVVEDSNPMPNLLHNSPTQVFNHAEALEGGILCHVEILNNGTGVSPSTSLTFQLLDGIEVAAGVLTSVSSLAPGETETVEVFIDYSTLPELFGGVYSVQSVVDPNSSIGEISESDNTFIFGTYAVLPDYEVIGATWNPSNVVVGEQVNWEAFVKNNGDIKSDVTTAMKIVLSSDLIYDPDTDILLWNGNIPANQDAPYLVGEVTEFASTFSFQAEHIGSWHALFVCDADDDVLESNEENFNVYSVFVNVSELGIGQSVGCNDPDACNYDAAAIAHDGTCSYVVDCNGVCGGGVELDACGICGGDNSTCLGCTDESSLNFDSAAIVDDGMCEYSFCTYTEELVLPEGDWEVTGTDNWAFASDRQYNSGNGRVLAYERVDGVFSTTPIEIVAEDGNQGDEFGYRVDADGDYLVVNARHGDGYLNNYGVVYLFKYENGQWIQKDRFSNQELLDWGAILQAAVTPLIGDLAIDGEFVAVTGVGYGVTSLFKIVSDQFVFLHNVSGGSSVDMSNGRLVIGDYSYSPVSAQTGIARVFTRAGNNYAATYSFQPMDLQEVTWQFGRTVAIYNDWIFVGGWTPFCGCGYSTVVSYHYESNVWVQKNFLYITGQQGSNISAYGNYLLVQRSYFDPVVGLLFKLDDNSWDNQINLLTPFDGNVYGGNIFMGSDYLMLPTGGGSASLFYCSDIGCTDSEACNFNPTATQDDGTCILNSGCTDEMACNYNPEAECDDDSCELTDSDSDGVLDCDDLCPQDSNKVEPGICGCGEIDADDDGDSIYNCYEVFGCSDSNACNYSPEVTEDDGSCIHNEEYRDCDGNCEHDFNQNGTCDEVETWGCLGDMNGDGFITVGDLTHFLGAFGNVCEDVE